MDQKKFESLNYDLMAIRLSLEAALKKATELRNEAGDEDALARWNGRVAQLERMLEDMGQFGNW